MLGAAIVVFGWNLFWIIEDLYKRRNYFDRFDIRKSKFHSIFHWTYLLFGISCLFFYFI